ncbi:hypothetical protein ACUODJ_27600, partial [Escherichia sp. HC-CC]
MTYAVEFDNVSRLYGDVRAVDGGFVEIVKTVGFTTFF